MTAPEAIRQRETNEIQTALPEIVLRDFSESELPALKQLLDSNTAFIVNGGINPGYIYQLTVGELSRPRLDNHHRMGIWQNDTLVGYIAVLPLEDKPLANKVEISYIVDPAYSRQGIASAAIEAVTEAETQKGNNVIAEVESRNVASIKLLGKLGFEHSGHSNGRQLYTRDTDIDKMSEQDIYDRLGL